MLTRERSVFDLAHEFRRLAFLEDAQASILDGDAELARCERADKHQLLGVLADVDETTSSGQPWSELADVQVTLRIRLSESKECCIEAATIVEIELIGLVNNRLRVDRRSEIEAACGHAADDAGFGSQREQIGDLLFVRDVCDTFRHTDAKIDNAIDVELQRRTTSNDFSFAHFHRLD